MGDKNKWLLVTLDRWLSYTVTIVQEFARADSELVVLQRWSFEQVWWWWWIVFMVWLSDERHLALFPVGTIVRDPHHRESPTRREQGLNLQRTWIQACWMKLCSSDNHYTTAFDCNALTVKLIQNNFVCLMVKRVQIFKWIISHSTTKSLVPPLHKFIIQNLDLFFCLFWETKFA